MQYVFNMLSSRHLLVRTNEVSIGCEGQVFFGIWHGEAGLESLRTYYQALEQFIRSKPNPVGFLTIVEPTSKPPSGPGRAFIASEAARLRHGILCSAATIEGEGMRSAASRFGMVALTMFSKQSNMFPHSVFADVDKAVAWLSTHAQLSIDESQVANAVTDCRFHFKGRVSVEK